MVAGISFYQICWFFLIYAFIGWIVEVIYHAVTYGEVVNRGFLNGPICPVYGFGALTVFAAVNTVAAGLAASAAGAPQKAEDINIWIVFFMGMLLTTAVELIAGWALDILFHARWWDYSNKPFNFRGYICLEFSIIWGLGIVFVVRIVHPTIRSYSVAAIDQRYGWPILALISSGVISPPKGDWITSFGAAACLLALFALTASTGAATASATASTGAAAASATASAAGLSA